MRSLAIVTLPEESAFCLLPTVRPCAGAKNREQIYSAFENIYPVTQKFRKVAEPAEGAAADSS